MKKLTKVMFALSIAMFATAALTACDDDDASVNGFVLQNQ